jgi:hypothetical protein
MKHFTRDSYEVRQRKAELGMVPHHGEPPRPGPGAWAHDTPHPGSIGTGREPQRYNSKERTA